MTDSGKLLRGPGGISYRLQVSRSRRSVGLTVTDTGELVVHAPRGLSQVAIHRIIAKNQAWIDKKQAERQEALNRLEKGKVYYRGKAYGVRSIPRGFTSIRLAEDVLLISLENSHTDPWPQLFGWYCQEAAALLTGRVHYFAPRMGLAPPTRLEVRNWRRRWGECRVDGRLRFNWRLVLLPPEIMDYVVVHELAHLLVPGHPPGFWREVGKYLPDYAQRRAWLKVYGSPFLIWKFEASEDGSE
jgi:predicted metal-dependent hydrolase